MGGRVPSTEPAGDPYFGSEPLPLVHAQDHFGNRAVYTLHTDHHRGEPVYGDLHVYRSGDGGQVPAGDVPSAISPEAVLAGTFTPGVVDVAASAHAAPGVLFIASVPAPFLGAAHSILDVPLAALNNGASEAIAGMALGVDPLSATTIGATAQLVEAALSASAEMSMSASTDVTLCDSSSPAMNASAVAAIEHRKAQRRKSHNAVERRRRDTLNALLQQLSQLVMLPVRLNLGAAEALVFDPAMSTRPVPSAAKNDVLGHATTRIRRLHAACMDMADLLSAIVNGCGDFRPRASALLEQHAETFEHVLAVSSHDER